MRRLHYAEPALRDLQAILDYIHERDPRAAQGVLGAIRRLADLLPANPKLGKPGRHRGTRELYVAGLPYVIVYRLTSDAVSVVSVLHTARDLPRAIRARMKGGRIP